MDDQSTLPSSYRSFIAYGGYDEPYAVPNRKVPVDSKGYAHTPPFAHAKGTDEDEKDETDKSVCVVADEEEPSEEGQPMNQTSL